MARKQNLPTLPPVNTFDVAPHRYIYDAPFDPAELERDTWAQVRSAAPYKPGEVVYHVDAGGFSRAYVHDVGCERDYYGWLRETYYLRFETKAGEWAKRAIKSHPGFIQRGYQRAGLAPEMPSDA